ncbi:MAG: amino acid ABC transporter substrate-binding protein, partial [Desulfobacteraceae bacterium]|nr:amino acid ABC transporter substrate-binding protein [Desulfobacteraceae bacterium]
KTIPHWDGIANLTGKQLVFGRGSNHLDILIKNHGDLLKNELDNAYGNPTYLGALQMLSLDRVDIFVVSNELLRTAISQYGIKYKKKLFETQFLNRTKYYPLFQNNEKGKQLAQIFDEGMQKLYDSGELQQLFKNSMNSTIFNIDAILTKAE